METYKQTLRCQNCTKVEGFEIEKGILVEDFCRMQKCSYCGCRNLIKAGLLPGFLEGATSTTGIGKVF